MSIAPQAGLMQRLQALLAQRGAPAMQAGQPQAQGGSNLGQAVAGQMAQLRGADPGLTVKQLEQMEKTIGVLITQNMQAVPGVSAALAPVIKSLQRAKKEAQQAMQTMQAMGPPIQFSPAQSMPGPDTQAGPELS